MTEKRIPKIAVATSSRADWGLLHPLVAALDQRGVKPVIIATYAHLFPELGDTIQELVDDGYPPAMSVPARRPIHEGMADTTTGFRKALSFLRPDLLIVLGDRVEMLGVATAALLENVPLAHIAGGTVSEGAVDDKIRNAISQMATFHFPETEKGRRKLILMGADPANVLTSGALGVFNALSVEPMSREDLERSLDFELGEQFLLGTFHPATVSTLSPIAQMKAWIAALEKALSDYPQLKLLLTFPNSDTNPDSLINLLYTLQTAHRDRVRVVPSLGRVRYLSAARHAAVVAGNSSSGIVELPSLGVPVIDVGPRQQGRERSAGVTHTSLDAEEFSAAVGQALRSGRHDFPNPYFREATPSLIANFILEKLQFSR